MRNNLKRIFRVMRASNLPEDKQKRLVGFLAMDSDQSLEPIAVQFERTPEWIPTFLEIVEKKYAALRDRNADLYRAAVADGITQFAK